MCMAKKHYDLTTIAFHGQIFRQITTIYDMYIHHIIWIIQTSLFVWTRQHAWTHHRPVYNFFPCEVVWLYDTYLGSKVPSISFYPDFVSIISRFYLDFVQILSRFYPDFIQILCRFYPTSKVFWRLILSKFYANFILILPQ